MSCVAVLNYIGRYYGVPALTLVALLCAVDLRHAHEQTCAYTFINSYTYAYVCIVCTVIYAGTGVHGYTCIHMTIHVVYAASLHSVCIPAF